MRIGFNRSIVQPRVTFSKLGAWGQFGNQLFQIAAVLGYAHKFGNLPRLPRWICRVSGTRYEDYFPWVKTFYGISFGRVYHEERFQYQDLPSRWSIDLRGNFQSERYFADITDTIKQLYAEPAHITDQLDEYCSRRDMTAFNAMHVRFYSHPSRDPGPMEMLPINYFRRAVEVLGNDVPLVIATDDKDQFANLAPLIGLPREAQVLNFENPLLDFYLMSRAGRIAISNSSFSWWAAYLGKEKQTIIAPHRYFWFNQIERLNPFWNTSDLYPPSFQEQII